MKLDIIRTLSDADGPFVTVYLEGRSPSEDAEDQLRLRWNAQREKLAEAGAGEDTLSAIDEALSTRTVTEIQTDGRVLVAHADGVLLNEPWDAQPGAGDDSSFGDIPELSAYVRERAGAVRILLAVVDQTGAVVRRLVATEDRNLDDSGEETVESRSDEPVRKPREGALSHNQIQRRADEAVKQNARGIAEHLDKTARNWAPDVVVLAGETQGRTAVKDELSTALAEITQDTDEGGLADTSGDNAQEALDRALSSIASDIAAGAALAQVDRFEEARARGRTAEGVHAVTQAAGMGAVETLLLTYDSPTRGESEAVVSCAQVDADVALIDAPLSGDIAAILRFEAPGELGSAELNG
ncbi:hypothetical protein [Corynebacterium sp.]|uniref:baeRF2 domain-containing protein n=1 Tax=Corynebacterium sp. TaxID=1720 RepID=UPI003B3BCCA9